MGSVFFRTTFRPRDGAAGTARGPGADDDLSLLLIVNKRERGRRWFRRRAPSYENNSVSCEMRWTCMCLIELLLYEAAVTP